MCKSGGIDCEGIGISKQNKWTIISDLCFFRRQYFRHVQLYINKANACVMFAFARAPVCAENHLAVNLNAWNMCSILILHRWKKNLKRCGMRLHSYTADSPAPLIDHQHHSIFDFNISCSQMPRSAIIHFLRDLTRVASDTFQGIGRTMARSNL